MQRPVSDIKAVYTEVRATQLHAPASPGNSSFKDHLSDIRKEESFKTAVSQLLRSKSYQAGKNPMKFGIVQSTLKDYDPNGKIAQNVAELDEKKATQIYHMIWERAGCSKLSPELASQHFAAYVRRPRTANEALQKAGGDPEKYAAAIKSVNNRTSHVDGHGVKPSLSKAAEVSGLTIIDQPKSSVAALIPMAEKQSVKETAVDNAMPVLSQDSGSGIRNEAVEAAQKADKGSSPENVVKESGSSENPAHLKPFRASEVFQNIQSHSKNSTELPIAANGITIAIEKRDLQFGVNAYEQARSGKSPADGMFVKLRIPF